MSMPILCLNKDLIMKLGMSMIYILKISLGFWHRTDCWGSTLNSQSTLSNQTVVKVWFKYAHLEEEVGWGGDVVIVKSSRYNFGFIESWSWKVQMFPEGLAVSWFTGSWLPDGRGKLDTLPFAFSDITPPQSGTEGCRLCMHNLRREGPAGKLADVPWCWANW